MFIPLTFFWGNIFAIYLATTNLYSFITFLLTLFVIPFFHLNLSVIAESESYLVWFKSLLFVLTFDLLIIFGSNYLAISI